MSGLSPEAGIRPTPPTVHPAALIAILSQYGAAMMQAQRFEGMLATLVGVVETNPNAGPTTLERSWRRIVKRDWHLSQRASASEMKRRLEGKIADDLLTDIAAMIGWRDFLAHRYLRVRLFSESTTEPRVDPTMTLELLELGQAFAELGERIKSEIVRDPGELAREGERHARERPADPRRHGPHTGHGPAAAFLPRG